MISKEKQTNIKWLFNCLFGVSIFNLLPLLFDKTSNFSFVIVFGFTAFFLFKAITSKVIFSSNIKTNFFYICLVIWSVIIFFRGITFNYDFYRSLLISPYVFLPYLFPFLVKYFTIYDFKKILNFIHYVNIVFLLFVLLYFRQPQNDIMLSIGFVEDLNKYLAFPAFFLLFSFKHLTTRRQIVSLLVFFIGFGISIYTARRSLTWTFGWAFIFFIYLLYSGYNGSLAKKFRFFLVIALISFAMYFVFQKYEQTFFGSLADKIDVDTRSTVLNDFERDMHLEDWIFGRGIGGGYQLRETGFEINNNYSNSRNIIEAGYLNLILKGGYIYLFLLFIIYLKAIYNGLFKSNNNFAKAFALFIILHMLELYPAGILTFNIRFLLIWYCIAMLWNKKFLQFTDENLKISLYK